MQVKAGILFFLCAFLLAPVFIIGAESLKEKIIFSYDFYGDNGDVRVYSPSVGIYKKLSEKFLLSAKLRVDAITAATKVYGGTYNRMDAVTGATPTNHFDEVRVAPSLAGTYSNGDDTVTAGGYYSTEYDYTGRALFANYTRQLNDQNTTLSAGVSRAFDKWAPKFKRDLPRYDRNETKIDLSAAQLLSPTFSAQVTYSYLRSEGFLASPYHYLLRDNFALFERYPDGKTGNAVALRLVKLLDEPTSVNFTYRYYKDTWDISSHTFNAELYRDIAKNLTIGARYRYYTQTKSNFLKPLSDYSMKDEFIAVDYRNSAFSSDDIGLMAIYRPQWKGLSVIDADKAKIKGSIDYYWTSANDYILYWYNRDRLKAVFTSISLEYDF